MAYEKFYKDFVKYEKVRQSGQYNMITEAVSAAKEAKLSTKKYTDIVHKYSFIKNEIEEKFGSVEAFINN